MATQGKNQLKYLYLGAKVLLKKPNGEYQKIYQKFVVIPQNQQKYCVKI